MASAETNSPTSAPDGFSRSMYVGSSVTTVMNPKLLANVTR